MVILRKIGYRLPRGITNSLTVRSKLLPCLLILLNIGVIYKQLMGLFLMLLLFWLQPQTPDQARNQIKNLIDPIMRHGRDNISYLYALDTFDWFIAILYFTILMLLAILGAYRVRMVWQFWR